MKRFLAWLLLGTLALSLCACAQEAAPVQTEASAPETTLAETTAAIEAPTEATEPAVQEVHLFLKVSSITFSLVGETDDIYLGLAPREEVTWESDDPNVVSVENGVLTATGVGTTTIRAIYNDQVQEITAGCLAQTQEALDSLDSAIVSAPKRLPPEVDLAAPCSYFDNSAIVGDSITWFLFQWEGKTNYLGDMLFLARGGVSMNGFVQRFKNIYYRGSERNLEDAICESQVDRVYFLMGSNDLHSTTQRPYLHDNWTILLDRIREKHPTVEFVLLANIPEYLESREPFGQNLLIEEYNVWLKGFAEEYGCHYLDLAYYVQDHYGRMPQIYSQGNYHMNEAGCLNWMKILRFYAQFESEGGTLS